MNEQEVVVFWFRRDLRLHNNHGLWQSLRSPYPVLPFFIFDREILDEINDRSDKRVSFIHQRLQQLNTALSRHGSTLYSVYGQPLEAIKELTGAYTIRGVYTNHDYEPYARERDHEVSQYLAEKGIPFRSFKDQVIFEKSEILKKDGTPYTVFTPYARVWRNKLTDDHLVTFPSESLLNNLLPEQSRPLPSLGSMGFSNVTVDVPDPLPDRDTVVSYEQNRNFPSRNGTSGISVHLRFGTCSIREVAAIGRENSEVWLNELIWREFFMMILYHFPRVVTENFKRKYDHIPWRNNKHEFERWCNGETGYPIVDAGMRELNATGFMHNRVRMITAGFLTKHLLIDWRWGEAYFAEKLLDYELSSNNGNWQWVAGTGCDSAPYFRIFNPLKQAEKFDPDREYTQKWLGNDHADIPQIVEHDLARTRALEAFRNALNPA